VVGRQVQGVHAKAVPYLPEHEHVGVMQMRQLTRLQLINLQAVGTSRQVAPRGRG
jgi:hypothetical protein